MVIISLCLTRRQDLRKFLPADIHAHPVLGIKVTVCQIGVDKENLQYVKSYRSAALVSQAVHGAFGLLLKIVPVLNIGLIAGEIIISQPVSEQDRRFPPVRAFVFLQDIMESALCIIASHGIEPAHSGAIGMDRTAAGCGKEGTVVTAAPSFS